MKNDRKINRVLYVVTVTMLLAISVVIAVTSVASRKKKQNAPEVNPPVSQTEEVTVKTPESTAPLTTDRRAETVSPETEKTPETSYEASDADPTSAEPPRFILPVLGVLSKNHDTENQVYSQTMNDYRVHTGIDITTNENAPVYAAADGVVSQIWDDPLMGKCIAISHSGDVYTVYKNLSDEAVAGIEEGASVSSGQLIAAVGNTAMVEIAEEPHLHFEMTAAGVSVDPLGYFDESALVSLTIDASYES